MTAQFRSPRGAVRYAFDSEAYEVVETSRFFRDMRGGTVRLPDDNSNLTPWDRAAQGAMVFGFILRNVTNKELIFLGAKLIQPTTPEAARRKRVCLAAVLELARAEFPKPPRYFTEDIVRQWAGISREQDLKEWAMQLGVKVQVVKRWIYGRRERRQRGILTYLRMVEQEIYDRLREPMIAAGLIPEDSG